MILSSQPKLNSPGFGSHFAQPAWRRTVLIPSGSMRSQYSQKLAKSRSSTSHPIVQLDFPTSLAPRGASVPMRVRSTCSGDRTRSGEVDGRTLYRPPYVTEETNTKTTDMKISVFMVEFLTRHGLCVNRTHITHNLQGFHEAACLPLLPNGQERHCRFGAWPRPIHQQS